MNEQQVFTVMGTTDVIKFTLNSVDMFCNAGTAFFIITIIVLVYHFIDDLRKKK